MVHSLFLLIKSSFPNPKTCRESALSPRSVPPCSHSTESTADTREDLRRGVETVLSEGRIYVDSRGISVYIFLSFLSLLYCQS